MNNPLISKTSFLKLEQCHKAFYLYKNHPYLRDKVSADKQLIFRRGHSVGYFARELFPGGIDVAAMADNSGEAIALTQKLIAENTPVIYEATFCHNNLLIMADILHHDEGKYTAYEVKSSLKISEVYIKDVCLQYYVLKNCLYNVEDIFLVTVNPDYVLQDKPDAKKMFRKRSLKQKAESNIAYFEHRLDEARLILERNAIPDISAGKHCFKPYQCDFFGSCWKNILEEGNLFSLPMVNKDKMFDWHESGIRSIEQIPESLLKKKQLKIRNALVSGETLIDHQKIREFLNRIKSPVAALDIEAWGPAIPELQGTRPFEPLPFLVGVTNGDDTTIFFTEHNHDDRRAFAAEMIRLTGKFETIAVFGSSMELTVISNLSALYPDLADELGSLRSKIVDLAPVFNELVYFDPLFGGNFSLKTIAGILFDDVSYADISSGLEAMNLYQDMRLATNPIVKEEIKARLIHYCSNDCAAVIRILDFLRQTEMKKPRT